MNMNSPSPFKRMDSSSSFNSSSPIDYLKLLNLTPSVIKEEAVILEIGSKMTKCGFSGESKPRAVFETNIKFDLTGEKVKNTKKKKKTKFEQKKKKDWFKFNFITFFKEKFLKKKIFEKK